MNSPAAIYQVSASDLEEVVSAAVRKVLDEQAAPAGFLRVPQAAEFLDLSEDALRALVKRGALPVHRVGSRLLFDRAELREFVRSGAAA